MKHCCIRNGLEGWILQSFCIHCINTRLKYYDTPIRKHRNTKHFRISSADNVEMIIWIRLSKTWKFCIEKLHVENLNIENGCLASECCARNNKALSDIAQNKQSFQFIIRFVRHVTTTRNNLGKKQQQQTAEAYVKVMNNAQCCKHLALLCWLEFHFKILC